MIWASSLVTAEVLEHARPDAEIVDSAAMPLEGVLALYQRAADEGLQSPASTPATRRCGARCRSSSTAATELGLEVEIVPGVSAFSAVAAIAERELTIPEVAQSVILTRLGGGKTPMPPGEEVREFARHGTTMALFLSAARSGQLQDELLEGGYAAGDARASSPTRRPGRTSWSCSCTLGDAASDRQGAQAVEAHAGPRRPGPRAPAAPARTCTTPATSTASAAPSRARRDCAAEPRLTRPQHVTASEPPSCASPICRAPMKVRQKALRTGWTTGTCAAAAAKAATTALATGPTQRTVDIAAARRRAGARFAGRLATSSSRPRTADRRRGQGRRRRPGRHPRRAPHRDRVLARRARAASSTAASASAWSPSPASASRSAVRPSTRRRGRRSRDAVGEVVDLDETGRPRRDQRARGRADGPQDHQRAGSASSAASRSSAPPASSGRSRPRRGGPASCRPCDVMAAQGERTLVLATGGRTEKAAMRLLPDLPRSASSRSATSPAPRCARPSTAG